MNTNYPPQLNKLLDVYFHIRKTDGTVDTTLTDLACRVVLDGRGMPGPTPRIVDAVTGICWVVLPEYLTNGKTIVFVATSATAGSVPYIEVIHTANQSFDTMARRELARSV